MRAPYIRVKDDYTSAPVFARASAAHIQSVQNLRRIRLAKKLSQQQLADLAGVTQPTVSRLENGDQNAGLDKVYAIARALKVEPTELFDLPELHARALAAIGRIAPEQREAALVVLEAMAGQPAQKRAAR